MPKATTRRTSGPTSVRAEPYPAMRPGDKPTTSKAKYLQESKDNYKPENGNPQELDKNGKPKPFTKASFLRAINGGQSNGLTRFLKAKQMMGGAENQVYPKAYAFFEKKRIFEGKKKTNTRLKVESDRPNGLPLRDPNRMYITCAIGENPRDFLDEYGQ